MLLTQDIYIDDVGFPYSYFILNTAGVISRHIQTNRIQYSNIHIVIISGETYLIRYFKYLLRIVEPEISFYTLKCLLSFF